MQTLFGLLWKFLHEEHGPTAVEYAVMLAMIVVVCAAAIQFLGQQTSTIFSTVGAKLNS